MANKSADLFNENVDHRSRMTMSPCGYAHKSLVHVKVIFDDVRVNVLNVHFCLYLTQYCLTIFGRYTREKSHETFLKYAVPSLVVTVGYAEFILQFLQSLGPRLQQLHHALR